MIDWLPIWVSLKLALTTTVVLLLLALPVVYLLWKLPHRISSFVESIVALPLVLPPTVIGFYLLLFFSPESTFGSWVDETFGFSLLFSFEGLVLGSVVYSFPFMIQPFLSGVRAFPSTMIESAYTLGLSPWQAFRKVIVPNVKPAIISASVLTFAHTIGEFGVILMIGGAIEGVTEVASVTIYDQVEAMRYDIAHSYSVVMIVMSFLILFVAKSVLRIKPSLWS